MSLIVLWWPSWRSWWIFSTFPEKTLMLGVPDRSFSSMDVFPLLKRPTPLKTFSKTHCIATVSLLMFLNPDPQVEFNAKLQVCLCFNFLYMTKSDYIIHLITKTSSTACKISTYVNSAQCLIKMAINLIAH